MRRTLLVITLLVVAGCGSKAASTAAPTSTAPPNTVPSTTSALAAWWSTVQPDYNTMEADLTTLTTDAQQQNVAALGTACSKLTTDTQTLQADGPAPDASLNGPFQAALADYGKAGTECSTAVATNDSTLMSQAITDLSAGTSQLSEADGQLKALG